MKRRTVCNNHELTPTVTGVSGRPAPPVSVGSAELRRSGAVMVEVAVVITVFLTLTLGGVDLLTGVYRNNTLSQAARYGARQAIVHGAFASPKMTVWGPAEHNGTAADGSEFATAVRPMLVGFPLSQVTIRVEWPDGGNAIGQRVRFTVSTPYRPLLGFIYGNRTYTLSGVSTMPIAH